MRAGVSRAMLPIFLRKIPQQMLCLTQKLGKLLPIMVADLFDLRSRHGHRCRHHLRRIWQFYRRLQHAGRRLLQHVHPLPHHDVRMTGQPLRHDAAGGAGVRCRVRAAAGGFRAAARRLAGIGISAGGGLAAERVGRTGAVGRFPVRVADRLWPTGHASAGKRVTGQSCVDATPSSVDGSFRGQIHLPWKDLRC